MAKSLYSPPTRMPSVLQGRSSRLQLYIALVALLLILWLTMGHCKNCGRLSENHHTNERPTPEATRFEPTVGSGIMAVYGSGSSFRDKLSSYLPRKGVTKRPLDRPEYSIKPLAYVFPQFHPIPENDKFWGENFTEWDFVQKMDINKYGLDILLPTEEVGYYNLLDLSVRQRWTDTIRNSR